MFNLLKETPKGYWIGYGGVLGINGVKKWISKDSRKRYAYPTKKEALLNFTKRTQRRTEILESQLKTCLTALRLANEINTE